MKQMFTELVGNDALRRRFGEDALAGKFLHACILEGPQGTGKHTMATMAAAAMVCTEKKDPTRPLPCLSCPMCRKVLEGKFPDLITVGREGKSSIGINVSRFLREDVHLVPNDSDHKIYVIEEADKLTHQAQNALLLTLEEPPKYVHFFLLCENAGLLLETIRSRAPIFRTEPISPEEIDRYLCAHDARAAQMKQMDPQGFSELVTASEMGIGRALRYLEPKEWAPVQQKRALATDFIKAAIQKEEASVIHPLLLRFSPKRDLLEEQLSTLANALRDLILLKKSEQAPLIFYANREEALELCDKAALPFLHGIYRAVQTAMEENARNANVRLCLIKMALSAELI